MAFARLELTLQSLPSLQIPCQPKSLIYSAYGAEIWLFCLLDVLRAD